MVEATMADMGLDGLIVIGGNGSLSVACDLHTQRGLPIVGVPKTIDNDIEGTEVTFGFNTAVQIATDAIDRLALPTPDPVPLRKKIAPHIAEARAHSDWSHLRRLPVATATDPGTRQIMVTRLAETLQSEFIGH